MFEIRLSVDSGQGRNHFQLPVSKTLSVDWCKCWELLRDVIKMLVSWLCNIRFDIQWWATGHMTEIWYRSNCILKMWIRQLRICGESSLRVNFETSRSVEIEVLIHVRNWSLPKLLDKTICGQPVKSQNEAFKFLLVLACIFQNTCSL